MLKYFSARCTSCSNVLFRTSRVWNTKRFILRAAMCNACEMISLNKYLRKVVTMNATATFFQTCAAYPQLCASGCTLQLKTCACTVFMLPTAMSFGQRTVVEDVRMSSTCENISIILCCVELSYASFQNTLALCDLLQHLFRIVVKFATRCASYPSHVCFSG